GSLGAIAQLGERYNGIVEVAGSIPAGSTRLTKKVQGFYASPSSRGPGHRPFTATTGVRIPLGTPDHRVAADRSSRGECLPRPVATAIMPAHLTRFAKCGAVVQLVRMLACHAGGRGFESRPLRHLV